MAEDHGDIHLRLSAQDETLKEQTRVLASVDTNVNLLRKELLGNGQPGRLTKIETKVENLEEHKNRALGWTLGAGAAISFALGLFEYLQHLQHARP
jgi:hypothetical protein